MAINCFQAGLSGAIQLHSIPYRSTPLQFTTVPLPSHSNSSLRKDKSRSCRAINRLQLVRRRKGQSLTESVQLWQFVGNCAYIDFALPSVCRCASERAHCCAVEQKSESEYKLPSVLIQEQRHSCFRTQNELGTTSSKLHCTSLSRLVPCCAHTSTVHYH